MLGEIADISIGRTPSRSDPSYWTTDLERPFCSIADIGPGRLISPSREGVTKKAVAEGKAKRVPARSLLMSFKLTIGRTGITATDVYPNEAIAWIKPHDEDETSQEFLRIVLPTLDFDSTSELPSKERRSTSVPLERSPFSSRQSRNSIESLTWLARLTSRWRSRLRNRHRATAGYPKADELVASLAYGDTWRHTTHPSLPLQAGGHRFDPGTLHLKRRALGWRSSPGYNAAALHEPQRTIPHELAGKPTRHIGGQIRRARAPQRRRPPLCR
jgi:hypothetical protein